MTQGNVEIRLVSFSDFFSLETVKSITHNTYRDGLVHFSPTTFFKIAVYEKHPSLRYLTNLNTKLIYFFTMYADDLSNLTNYVYMEHYIRVYQSRFVPREGLFNTCKKPERDRGNVSCTQT